MQKEPKTEIKIERKSAVVPSSNVPYILSVAIMSIVTVIGVVTIQTLRPEVDNTNIIIQLLGFAITITTSIFAAMKSQDTHKAVNSRIDEWLEKAEKLAQAKGVEEGIASANARTDELAKKKRGK